MAAGFASQADGAPVVPGGGFASQAVEPPAAGPAPVAPTGTTVNVISPVDGKRYGLDAAYLAQAKAQGYQVESPEAAAMRAYVEQKGLTGKASVFLSRFVNEASFGASDAIVEGMVERGILDPYKAARWQALQTEHDTIGKAGSVLGFGAGLAFGAPLFEGAQAAGAASRARFLGTAEKTLAKQISAEAAYRIGEEGAVEVAKHAPGIARKALAYGADYATQGAYFAAPKAAAQLLTGDPDKAAETWIWGAAGGAALGGVVGAAGGVLGRMGGGAASKALPAVASEASAIERVQSDGLMAKARKWAEATADSQAFRSIASSEASLGKIVKDLELQFGDDAADKVGRYLRENGLIKQFGAGARDEAKRFAQNAAGEGRAVGNFWKTAESRFGAESRLDVGELSTKIKEKALRPLYEENFGMEGLAESLTKKLDSFDRMAMKRAGADGKISLADAHDLQRMFDRHIKFSALNTAEQETINTVMADARRALHAELMAKVEASGGAEALAEIKSLNERFSISTAIAKGAKDYVKRDKKNRVPSPTDYLGAIAGLLGGTVTGGAGLGALGALAVGYGHHIVRKEGNAVAARALGSFAEGKGLAELEGAFARHNEQLSLVPAVIDRMSGKRSAARETLGVNVLSRFLGIEDRSKLDKPQDVMAFAEQMAALASNPDDMETRSKAAIAPLSADAPEVAFAVAAKLPQVASYLASQAPRSPYAVPTPFTPTPQWKPTDAQIKDYRTKVAVALDPFKALDALADGTLTKAHVDALQAVAPKLYGEMLKRINDYGSSGKAPSLPYAQRLKLSMLTGAPLDRSLAQLSNLQGIYATKDAAKVEGGGKLSKAPALQQTDIARVTG